MRRYILLILPSLAKGPMLAFLGLPGAGVVLVRE